MRTGPNGTCPNCRADVPDGSWAKIFISYSQHDTISQKYEELRKAYAQLASNEKKLQQKYERLQMLFRRAKSRVVSRSLSINVAENTPKRPKKYFCRVG